MAVDPVVELEVTRVVRIGERVAHDEVAVAVALPIEGEAGRVWPSVLHRLEHLGHVPPDPVRPVPVDDPCDSAHELALVLLSRLRQNVEVFLHVPVTHLGAIPLPLVLLVVHEDTVHVTW